MEPVGEEFILIPCSVTDVPSAKEYLTSLLLLAVVEIELAEISIRSEV